MRHRQRELSSLEQLYKLKRGFICVVIFESVSVCVFPYCKGQLRLKFGLRRGITECQGGHRI